MRKVAKLGYRGSKRVQTVNTEPSMTIQSDAHLADIHQIMKSYGQEGKGLESLNDAEGTYADVTEFTDLADAMNQAKAAEQDFMKLPSKYRELFDHKVENWLDAAHDTDKREAIHAKMVERGYIKTVSEDSEAGSTTVDGVGEKTSEEGTSK